MLAAIVTIGPVTVAASMFPAAARRGDAAALRTLHRICIVVPVFGVATALVPGIGGPLVLRRLGAARQAQPGRR